MSAPLDLIIPGSFRVEVRTWETRLVTLRCGRCGAEFDARSECRTTRCGNCGRVCRLDTAQQAGPNVIPFRPRRKAPAARPAIA